MQLISQKSSVLSYLLVKTTRS